MRSEYSCSGVRGLIPYRVKSFFFTENNQDRRWVSPGLLVGCYGDSFFRSRTTA